MTIACSENLHDDWKSGGPNRAVPDCDERVSAPAPGLRRHTEMVGQDSRGRPLVRREGPAEFDAGIVASPVVAPTKHKP